MMTKRERVKRGIWLSWMELPWEKVRLQVIREMDDLGMSHEDLAYELRRVGYWVSQPTVSKWLRGGTNKVPMEALQAIVTVVAEARAGGWSKGAFLTQAGDPMDTDGDGGGQTSYLVQAS